MIKVLIKPREVIISGHAESAPKGQDLVCCAVSTLYSSLVANLLDSAKNKDNVEYDGIEGNARVKVKKFETSSYYAFKFFRVAIKALSKEYDKYIEVEDKIDNAKSLRHKK